MRLNFFSLFITILFINNCMAREIPHVNRNGAVIVHEEETNKEEKKILFLGDSFTVGTGLGKGFEQGSFPYQLVKQLRANGIAVHDPIMYAVDGDTTKHLLGALNCAEPQSNPDEAQPRGRNYYDLVVLSIGINDLFRGHSLEDYQHHFKELLLRAINFAGNDSSKVLVVSIPAWDASPSVYNNSGPKFRAGKYAQVRKNINEISIPIKAIQINIDGQVTLTEPIQIIKSKIQIAQNYNTQAGIAKSINEFNEAAKNLIDAENHKHNFQKNIIFIDITSISREGAILNKNTPSPNLKLFAKDGIHYSEIMYDKWARYILPIAKNKLEKH